MKLKEINKCLLPRISQVHIYRSRFIVVDCSKENARKSTNIKQGSQRLEQENRQTIKDWVYASKSLKDSVADGCLPHSICGSNRAMGISDEMEVVSIAVDESKIV